MNVSIIYFSSSGKTTLLAERLAGELKRQGAAVRVAEFDEVRLSSFDGAEMVLFGSPAWSGERVVPALADYIIETADTLRGKRIGFFGCYDWGDGTFFDHLVKELQARNLEVMESKLLWQIREEATEEALAAFVSELLGAKAKE